MYKLTITELEEITKTLLLNNKVLESLNTGKGKKIDEMIKTNHELVNKINTNCNL